MKLTDDFVDDIPLADTGAGKRYADGHGFYLHCKSAGKYWRMDYRFGDKQKTLALGVYPAVSLELARTKAHSARELLRGGVDPSESRKTARQVGREAPQGQRPRHPGAVIRDVVLPGLSITAESFADMLRQ